MTTPIQLIDSHIAEAEKLEDTAESGPILRALNKLRGELYDKQCHSECHIVEADGISLSTTVDGISSWVFTDTHSAEQLRRLNMHRTGTGDEFTLKRVVVYVED